MTTASAMGLADAIASTLAAAPVATFSLAFTTKSVAVPSAEARDCDRVEVQCVPGSEKSEALTRTAIKRTITASFGVIARVTDARTASALMSLAAEIRAYLYGKTAIGSTIINVTERTPYDMPAMDSTKVFVGVSECSVILAGAE